MDPNELLKLLDLSAKLARPPDTPAPRAGADAPPPGSAGPKSPTALEIDAWGLRRGRDLVAESGGRRWPTGWTMWLASSREATSVGS